MPTYQLLSFPSTKYTVPQEEGLYSSEFYHLSSKELKGSYIISAGFQCKVEKTGDMQILNIVVE